MPMRNVALALLEAFHRHGPRPAFALRDGEGWRHISYAEFGERSLCIAEGLIDLGLKAREHVALFADNRLEWMLASCAIGIAGAADVPRGADATDADVRYILAHSDAVFAIAEDERILRRMLSQRERFPMVRRFLTLAEGANYAADSLSLAQVEARGRELRNDGSRLAEARASAIKNEDLFTLIYTSGTTGEPKGVMLTHSNACSQLQNTPMRFAPTDRMLSILPVWHIFERAFEVLSIYSGACTYYSSVRTLREDLATARPTMMASAPRLWESIYNGILTRVEQGKALPRALFRLAVWFARRRGAARRRLSGRNLKLQRRSLPVEAAARAIAAIALVVLSPFHVFFDYLVLRKIRRATGGALRGSVSGGGALPWHVDLFFNDIGIPVLEGYGLTETSPVLAMRTFNHMVPGTVGPLFPKTELRLVDLNTGELVYPGADGFGRPGEVHVRGPQLMKGYYKRPDLTEQVVHDGWFNTGDIGVMTYNQMLKIVGRSKDTIVLLGGENVEPTPIENRLQGSPLIAQAMVVGQDRKFLGALIVPNPERYPGTPFEELAENPLLREALRTEIKRLINQDNGFKAFERVVDFRILPKPFEPGDELTAKLSLRRHIVSERYAELIEEIYREREPARAERR